MMSFLTDFHFLRPWMLLLVFVPALLYYLYGNIPENQSSWRKVVDANLLKFLLMKNSANQRRFFILTSFIGLFLTVFIFAGPSWEKAERPALQKQNPVIVMLNLSSDMQETDLKPNRLERAKYKITDFLSLLESTQTSLGVYTDEPYIIAPLTEDVAIIQNLLPKVNFDIMPSNGDRLDRAINMGVSRIQQASFSQGSLVIFAPDVGQKFNLAVEAAKKAAAQGIEVNIINTGASANDKLKLVAVSGSGTYLELQANDDDIRQIAEQINHRITPLQQSDNLAEQWMDAGWYLLFIPLICCLLLFRKGIVGLVFWLSISEAYAGFFTNRNQDALQSFQQQDYQTSADKFDNSAWKAASFYRLGQYDNAYKYYSEDNSPDGLYNQGNALAKSGKIKEAISKYEEVLQLQPNHEDAKFNLEYLKQQQQNQSSQQNKNSDKSNQNDSEQNQGENQNQNDEQNQNTDNSSANNENAEGQEQKQPEEQAAQSDASPDQSDNSSQSQNTPSQSDEPDANDKNQDSAEDQRNDQNSQESSDTDFLDENQTDSQGNPSSSGQMEAQAGDDDYDEKVQAKAQRYREIPEDVGGLLRAFISQEHKKNRYKDE